MDDPLHKPSQSRWPSWTVPALFLLWWGFCLSLGCAALYALIHFAIKLW